jgi:hypothetical protein
LLFKREIGRGKAGRGKKRRREGGSNERGEGKEDAAGQAEARRVGREVFAVCQKSNGSV